MTPSQPPTSNEELVPRQNEIAHEANALPNARLPPTIPVRKSSLRSITLQSSHPKNESKRLTLTTPRARLSMRDPDMQGAMSLFKFALMTAHGIGEEERRKRRVIEEGLLGSRDGREGRQNNDYDDGMVAAEDRARSRSSNASSFTRRLEGRKVRRPYQGELGGNDTCEEGLRHESLQRSILEGGTSAPDERPLASSVLQPSSSLDKVQRHNPQTENHKPLNERLGGGRSGRNSLQASSSLGILSIRASANLMSPTRLPVETIPVRSTDSEPFDKVVTTNLEVTRDDVEYLLSDPDPSIRDLARKALKGTLASPQSPATTPQLQVAHGTQVPKESSNRKLRSRRVAFKTSSSECVAEKPSRVAITPEVSLAQSNAQASLSRVNARSPETQAILERLKARLAEGSKAREETIAAIQLSVKVSQEAIAGNKRAKSKSANWK